MQRLSVALVDVLVFQYCFLVAVIVLICHIDCVVLDFYAFEEMSFRWFFSAI